MRMHIELDDDLAEQLDQLAGPRGRSAFVRSAIERALEQELRWRDLGAAAGSLEDSAHAWDTDVAGWVREQRHADSRRTG